jgi:ATP/ADP translocase
MIVSYHMSVRNRSCVFCKGSEYFLFCFVLFCFVLFFETGFLCVALAVLELNFVDQAGLELRNLPASAS